jgi:hypothetical protein
MCIGVSVCPWAFGNGLHFAGQSLYERQRRVAFAVAAELATIAVCFVSKVLAAFVATHRQSPFGLLDFHDCETDLIAVV